MEGGNRAEVSLSHIVVIDFEATCDHGDNPKITRENQEIIEFPWVVIDLAEARVVDKQQFYVKPEWSTSLTPFCTDLTGITWPQLQEAPPLAEAVAAFDAYIQENFIAKDKGFCILTDGDWDLKVCLLQEARKKGIPLAPYFLTYYDLKNEFLRSGAWRPGSKPSLRNMLDTLELPFVGRSHRGIDDCANIATVVLKLLEEGHCFESPEEIPPDYDPALDPSFRDFNKHPSLFYRMPEGSQQETNVVVLRGLPWTTTEEQIEEFFGDLEINEGGVHLITNRSGRPSGIAYVEFKEAAHAVQALEKNDSHLGERYIEVYLSDDSKMKVILEGQGKVVPVTGEETRPGDWTCPNCSDHQFASRMFCRKCRTPRPDFMHHTNRPITNPMHPAYAGFIPQHGGHHHQHPHPHAHAQHQHPHAHHQHHHQRAFMPHHQQQPHFQKHHQHQMHPHPHARQQGPPFHPHAQAHHHHMHAQPQAFFVAPAQNGAAPVEVRPGDWWCTRCAELNFASRRVCRKCGNSSPAFPDNPPPFRMGGRGGRGKGRGGRGGRGHYDNHNGGGNYSGDNGGQQQQKPNWYCPNCNDLNYGVRAVCRKCATPNSNSEAAASPQVEGQGQRAKYVPGWQ